MPRILISNDDGIYGQGLKPLIRAMRPLGELVVIVPDGERSAASHSITLHKPFRIQTLPMELSKSDVLHVYISNGTPSDCVRFGLLELLKHKRVDLVVGGINHGANLGEDIIYSGTVAVAREAAMQGIPALAVSVVDSHHKSFEAAANITQKVSRMILRDKLPSRVFLNINVPHVNGSKPKVEITRLGRRVYGKVIPSGVDPRGHLYYWLAGDIPKGIPEPGTDIWAIKSKKISVTPLTVDSAAPILADIHRWKL
ncbi:MAG: 5'/3'-nucleotidase SurE [Elusimicrobia bacterium RIFCSPLOWO2_01_FULL_54_10]|nr:MAG: 5'/3'-nucleotidase SurE [Elusimicrobia bacterium RIFCSPLOWO2_01_FULL_54_10]